ncbi:RGL1 protein, partial [Galbula dea]|nr:RGL1 protein [Galbula dea]
EEVEEGAVYSVLLRRVQIQQAEGARGLKVEEDQFSPEHTANQYKTCKIRTIKAGTLEKLVENLLTAFEDNDFTYITIFLSTYRAFASTKEVLELLLDRYGNSKTLSCEKLKPHNFSKPNREVRIAIGSISKAWLDECPEDFREPPDYPCLLKLLDYLQRNIPNSEPERRAQNLLELFLSQEVETCCEFHDSFLCNLSEEELLISCPEDLEFFLFPEDLVAEQLTYMDAELFKRVVPHHCLGCIWSQRHKEENKHLVATINATISQFNAVSRCVTNTILKNKALKAQERAKTIEKWICIASECRSLKNFSSLKAIISALQSNSICKLKKAWAYVKKDTKLMFNELSGIFPSHDNYLTPRNLLFQTRLQAPGSAQEGTSKSEDLDCSLIGYHRRTQRQLHFQTDRVDVQGTVPYLGTFLTDLIMLDTALQDYVEGSLINFEKMRREFEVIDQIKLLQSACNSYCMTPDTTFIQWFTEQQHLTEEESPALFCCLLLASMLSFYTRPFPSTDVLAQSTPIIWQHKFAPAGSSVESMDLTSDSTSEDDHIIFKGSSEESLKKVWISVPIATNKHSVSSSMDESSVSSAIDNCSLSSSNNESSVSLTSITSKVLPPLYNQQKEDLCIIQTKVENNHNMNKNILGSESLIATLSLQLTSQDKTDSVIQRGILKHNLESDTAEDYELLQIIPEAKELVLSASAKMLNGHVNFDSILWKTALGSRQVQMTGHCRPKLPRAARWDHWAS